MGKGLVSGINFQLPHCFFVSNIDPNPRIVRLMDITALYSACIYEFVGRTASNGLFNLHLYFNGRTNNITYKINFINKSF